VTSKEYTRPATVDDLKLVIKSLNDNNVPYLLIGGYALFAHGHHRATEDIDILIPAGADVGKLVKSALMVLPDKSAESLEDEWFEQGENMRLADEVIVDIMFNACGETFDSMVEYTEDIDLDGIPVKTLNLEGLLKTKQTQRDKDIADRLVLEKVLSLVKGRE